MGLGRGWNECHASIIEGLNDSATIIVSTERIIDGVVGGIEGGVRFVGFFVFLFFRERLIVGGWPLFAMVFGRGWD